MSQLKKSYQPTADELLDHITECIIVTDLDGVVTYWNPACGCMFGYSKDEILHQPLSKIYPFVVEDKFYENLDKLKSGHELQEQWKGITKDGSVIWVDINAKLLFDNNNKPKAILASAHNISGMKKVETELEENKARAQAILETTVDGIITIDTEGKILSFNQSASRIFGYSEEEVLGENIRILMPEPHSSKHDYYLKRYNETGEKRIIGQRREVRGKRKDSTLFPMELSVGEAQWNGKRIFTGVVNDISERRRLEHEILRISEEERRNLGQDLHDGLGQMLTGIGLISKNLAHRLKANDDPGADEVQEIANMIQEADECAKALAHGLVHVDFEKEGLHTALKQLSRQAEKFFNVKCKFENKTDISIHNSMQTMHLYRIAQEAISNAVKHGKASNIELSLSTNNGNLLLSVKDDGMGFSKSAKEKKEKGMGIHIMRYRANMLSGCIEIQETKDQGANIVCRIPHNT